jgi:hypothetical protein
MSKTIAALMSSTSRFAHLLGRAAPAKAAAPAKPAPAPAVPAVAAAIPPAARAEDEKKKDDEAAAEGDDDERKKRDGESDDDYAKRIKKLDDDARAEEEEKKKEDEAAEDDAEGDEMRGSSPIAQARRRERDRCAAIFASPGAATRPDVAAQLAFESNMPRHEAVALLGSVAGGGAPPAPRAAGSRLEERMARVASDTPNPGTGPTPAAPGSAEALVARATAAYGRATGKK